MGATKGITAGSTRQTRTYSSPRRRQQAADTRSAVIAGARTLFSSRGWSGTSMRDVAREAEVSVETLYSLFGSKVNLFQAALDVAVAGDSREIPVADREEFRVIASGSGRDRVRAATHLVARSHQDAAGLERALREAAASDPALSRVLAENEERRRADVALGFELATGRTPSATERDGAWGLLSFELYELLVERSGWDAERYEEWLAEILSFTLGVRPRRDDIEESRNDESK